MAGTSETVAEAGAAALEALRGAVQRGGRRVLVIADAEEAFAPFVRAASVSGGRLGAWGASSDAPLPVPSAADELLKQAVRLFVAWVAQTGGRRREDLTPLSSPSPSPSPSPPGTPMPASALLTAMYLLHLRQLREARQGLVPCAREMAGRLLPAVAEVLRRARDSGPRPEHFVLLSALGRDRRCFTAGELQAITPSLASAIAAFQQAAEAAGTPRHHLYVVDALWRLQRMCAREADGAASTWLHAALRATVGGASAGDDGGPPDARALELLERGADLALVSPPHGGDLRGLLADGVVPLVARLAAAPAEHAAASHLAHAVRLLAGVVRLARPAHKRLLVVCRRALAPALKAHATSGEVACATLLAVREVATLARAAVPGKPGLAPGLGGLVANCALALDRAGRDAGRGSEAALRGAWDMVLERAGACLPELWKKCVAEPCERAAARAVAADRLAFAFSGGGAEALARLSPEQLELVARVAGDHEGLWGTLLATRWPWGAGAGAAGAGPLAAAAAASHATVLPLAANAAAGMAAGARAGAVASVAAWWLGGAAPAGATVSGVRALFGGVEEAASVAEDERLAMTLAVCAAARELGGAEEWAEAALGCTRALKRLSKCTEVTARGGRGGGSSGGGGGTKTMRGQACVAVDDAAVRLLCEPVSRREWELDAASAEALGLLFAEYVGCFLLWAVATRPVRLDGVAGRPLVSGAAVQLDGSCREGLACAHPACALPGALLGALGDACDGAALELAVRMATGLVEAACTAAATAATVRGPGETFARVTADGSVHLCSAACVAGLPALVAAVLRLAPPDHEATLELAAAAERAVRAFGEEPDGGGGGAAAAALGEAYQWFEHLDGVAAPFTLKGALQSLRKRRSRQFTDMMLSAATASSSAQSGTNAAAASSLGASKEEEEAEEEAAAVVVEEREEEEDRSVEDGSLQGSEDAESPPRARERHVVSLDPSPAPSSPPQRVRLGRPPGYTHQRSQSQSQGAGAAGVPLYNTLDELAFSSPKRGASEREGGAAAPPPKRQQQRASSPPAGSPEDAAAAAAERHVDAALGAAGDLPPEEAGPLLELLERRLKEARERLRLKGSK